MKEHPDYKYRPRRKAKSLVKKDNRYHFQLPMFQPMLESLRPFYPPHHLLPHPGVPGSAEKSPGDIPRPFLPHPHIFPPHLAGLPYPPVDPAVLSRIHSPDSLGLPKSSESLTLSKMAAVESSFFSRLPSHDIFGIPRLPSPPLQSHLSSPHLPSSSGLPTATGVPSSSSVLSSPIHHPGPASPSLTPTTSLASPIPKYPPEVSANSVLSRLQLDNPYLGLTTRDLEHLRFQQLHTLERERRLREELAVSPPPSRSRSPSPSSPKIDVDSRSRESSPARSPPKMDSPPPTEERAFRRFSELSTREGDLEASNSDESRAFVKYREERSFMCGSPPSSSRSPAPSPGEGVRLPQPFTPASLATTLYSTVPHLPVSAASVTVSSADIARSYLGSCVYPPGSSVGYPPDPRTALSYLLVRPEAKYLPAPALLPSLTPTLTSASPPSVVQ
ncbi:hypothetical protein Pcinc_032231 [Petrolisthes cinctipes]|uniref:Uncharacterized protein n=2 Tax=Petrolisthes TaxID=84661 RepID=A0AAE1K3B7_PETCI|nr:hypothetical protein Pcinc_032231 [Petrolisthes cinctipes]